MEHSSHPKYFFCFSSNTKITINDISTVYQNYQQFCDITDRVPIWNFVFLLSNVDYTNVEVISHASLLSNIHPMLVYTKFIFMTHTFPLFLQEHK